LEFHEQQVETQKVEIIQKLVNYLYVNILKIFVNY